MKQLRGLAVKLRNKGYSYAMIGDKLGLQKSTLSNWLSGIPFVPNQEVLNRIGNAKLRSGFDKHEAKIKDIELRKKEARKEIGKVSERDLFMLGIGLYMGEGSKAIEEVRIVNSDAAIIKLAIKWLEEACKIPKNNLEITLHGYPDNNDAKIKKFWSQETGIPIKRFGKTIIDHRINKSKINHRKLPNGTAHLYARVRKTLVPGVKSRHRKIMGWIESVMKKIS